MIDFNKKNMKELKDYCRNNNIIGYSNKKKKELIVMIEKYNNKNKQEKINSFKKYKRTDNIIYELSEKEINDKKEEEEYKNSFINQLSIWHNLLRGCSVTGEDALDDILYCLFICYLFPKISTKGDFDLANNEKSCYKGIIQRKINDWISKLNIDYLIDNTAELVTKKIEDSSIYKCGELLSRHPMTKQLIKNKKFINCNNNIILSKLLKSCKEYSIKNNIFDKIDIIGTAWEYFNTKHGGNGGSSKERGQYFTERHIMSPCFKLIEPSHIKELGINNDSTIGDEFCGSFGFPLYAKKYLHDKFKINIKDKNMYGIEFADRLSRFGIMNAMFSLKNFKNIRSGDSFINNVYPHLDFSIHNVPFGKSMDCANIKEMYLNEIENNNLPNFNDVIPIEKNGDAMLSCQLVLYKTKKMGLVIIKDGEETTGSSNKEWREWFCDSCIIHKIMKIPTGAFSHTGTKTVCIYFTKRKGQKTEKIQFLEMSDTGDKITEICEVTRNDLEQNNYSWDPNVYIVDEEMEKLIASSGCEWKKLGEVCEIEQGSSLLKKNMVNGEYKVIGGGKIIGNHNINNRNGEETTITRVGELTVSFIDEKFYLTENGFSIKHSNNITNKFMYYLLSKTSLKSSLRLLYGGSGRPVISKTKVENFEIPIPSQEIQIQVVQTLDDLANLCQNYIDIRDGLKRRMKYYFEMMIKRYRGEITMKKLEDVTPIVIGSTPSKKENKYWEIGTHTWVTVSELNNTTIPITNSVKKLTDTAISECNPRLVKKGSILMSFKLSIGKMAIAGCDLYTNEAIVHINTNNELSNKWLYYYYLCYPPTIGASGCIGGGNLNKDKLKKIEFIDMPDNIKTQIVQYLDNLEAEKNKITEILQQLDTEMCEILTQTYE
jgi:restriction endonuclease S subunit